MSIQHAYSVTNLLRSLSAAAFTWSDSTTANRAFLFDNRMDKVFSTGAGVGKTLTIDLGSAQTAQCFAILNCNLCRLGGTPTVKVEVGTTDDGAFAVPIVVKADSTPPSFGTYGDTRAKDVVLQFAATTKRYWRITFAWSGSAVLTIGELWMGAVTALSRAIIYGHEAPERIKKTSFESHSGEVRSTYISGPHRGRVLGWKDLSTTEGRELMAMWRFTKGGALPMLWIEQREATAAAATEATMECLFGHIVPDEVRLRETDFQLFDPDVIELRSYAREVGA